MSASTKELYIIEWLDGAEWRMMLGQRGLLVFFRDQSAQNIVTANLAHKHAGRLWRTTRYQSNGVMLEPTGWQYDCRAQS